MQVTENMVAGTELNRRRQPFQGCSLPQLIRAHQIAFLGPHTSDKVASELNTIQSFTARHFADFLYSANVWIANYPYPVS